MKINSRVLRAVPWITYALAVAVTAFQSLAFAYAYEAPKANYFAAESPLPILATSIALIGVLGSIVFFLILPKDRFSDEKLPSPLASLASAFGFLGGAVTLILSSDTKLAKATFVSLILSAAYALLVAFARRMEAYIQALVGFATILSCILLSATYYFDKTLEMNAPVKISVLMGLLSAMLYYTAELRCLLGNAAPRLHRALSVIASAVGALSALVIPIAVVLGKFDSSVTHKHAPLLAQTLSHPEYLAGALIVLGTLLTASIRLWSLMRQETGSEDATLSHSTPNENGGEEEA